MTEADRALLELWEKAAIGHPKSEIGDLCRIIRELEAERDALRARCERLVKALEWFMDQSCSWLETRVPEARPGWMRPTIDRAEAALKEDER